MTELNNLSKEELIDLAKHLLIYHQGHYQAVEVFDKEEKETDAAQYLQKRTELIESRFFQYAGNVQAIRRNFGLPKLY